MTILRVTGEAVPYRRKNPSSGNTTKEVVRFHAPQNRFETFAANLSMTPNRMTVEKWTSRPLRRPFKP
jgi:hypothetical protein